jgi:hypothetical protein
LSKEQEKMLADKMKCRDFSIKSDEAARVEKAFMKIDEGKDLPDVVKKRLNEILKETHGIRTYYHV